jgi:hypothetical protein
MKTSTVLKKFSTAAVGANVAIMALNPLVAIAGNLHAQSTIGLVSKSRCAPAWPNSSAHAEVKIGKKYRVSHEELYYNYTYGNAGTGHAHYHPGTCVSFGSADLQPPFDPPSFDPPLPVMGSEGTSQYIGQTWVPNSTNDQITVTWLPESFLQIDLDDLSSDKPLISSASLTADGGLTGTIELSALLNLATGEADIKANLTGVFQPLSYRLTPLTPYSNNNVIALQLTSPATWIVQADPNTFDIELSGTIDGVSESVSVPESSLVIPLLSLMVLGLVQRLK